MASLGHIAVGMAAARIHHDRQGPRWTSTMLWSALSMLPDADVIGFAMGVNYGDPWGHRGATHSLAFSIALGTAVGLSAPTTDRSRDEVSRAVERFAEQHVSCRRTLK